MDAKEILSFSVPVKCIYNTHEIAIFREHMPSLKPFYEIHNLQQMLQPVPACTYIKCGFSNVMSTYMRKSYYKTFKYKIHLKCIKFN